MSDSVERTYASAELLETVGPLVPATWSIPPKQLPLNPRFRQSMAEPVTGYMAIDTGANRTWIAQAVVDELALAPFRSETAHGSNGVHQTPIYLAELTVPFGGSALTESALTSVLAVAPVPGLSKMLPLRERETDARIVGLLGRDFLRHVVMTYDGPGGAFRLELDRRDVGVRVA